MHPAFSQLAHRPWPVPAGAWRWRQSWHELLFIHWPVPVRYLAPLVPPQLTIQEFEGSSWIGVVPFRMSGVMLRGLPDLPWISAFPELNVRLYVAAEGKPGVWFLSLDAANPLAVWAARRFFHLPYFGAEMSVKREGETIHYDSRRRKGKASFHGTYRPVGPVYKAAAGSLEHWLTERYCLYAQRPDGTLLRNEVHHAQWPLQPAEADLAENSMFEMHGIPTEGSPMLHYSAGVDVVVWPAEKVYP